MVPAEASVPQLSVARSRLPAKERLELLRYRGDLVHSGQDRRGVVSIRSRQCVSLTSSRAKILKKGLGLMEGKTYVEDKFVLRRSGVFVCHETPGTRTTLWWSSPPRGDGTRFLGMECLGVSRSLLGNLFKEDVMACRSERGWPGEDASLDPVGFPHQFRGHVVVVWVPAWEAGGLTLVGLTLVDLSLLPSRQPTRKSRSLRWCERCARVHLQVSSRVT